jgi:Tryptophan halogenase
MKRIIVVGGGTAGIMAAALANTHYGKNAEIVLIFDHSKPSIGVGESLTPKIHQFLREVGITAIDLIKNCNATIKLGIKFKNWLNNDNYHWHSFLHLDVVSRIAPNYENLAAAYDIINDQYDLDVMYSPWYMENNMLPDINTQAFSMHFDVLAFNNYILEKAKNRITILDDNVLDVIKDNDIITSLVLAKNGNMSADLYIDASGRDSVLMKKLPNKWIDKSDELPVNSFIPNPISLNAIDKNIPCYSVAEAATHGWALQVPLQSRYGTGYIYSSQFTTDEEAFEDFAKLTKKNYNKTLANKDKIIRFKSGYWEKQWVGNCVVVGLASSFAEPLEATNIHHTITQLFAFFRLYNFKLLEFDRSKYNKEQIDVIENIYLYIRYCYTTGRTDSKFWEYMTNNTPQKVKDLEEKANNSFFTKHNFFEEIVFGYTNFTPISYGLGKFNKQAIKDILIVRNRYEEARMLSEQLTQIKENARKQYSIRHSKFLNSVLNNTLQITAPGNLNPLSNPNNLAPV